ncbi:MAG TPA: VWA domain-containing protein [Pyrinomonadaceae bacterium]|jgi:Ca-activated chloride channel family protein|nr:VWA domain-containing protein [Pyrinomonadaceae bacterium]
MRTAVYSLLFAAAALALSFAAALAFDAPVAAQQNSNAQPRPTATPRPAQDQDDVQVGPVFTREVQLPITVMDKKEQLVAGLKMSDFIVFEDKQPQQIASFRDESAGTPIYVAVLMDTSASASAKLRFEKESAKDFLYTVVRVRKDKAAFATFDDDVNLLQDFTDKLDKLDTAVDSVKKPGENTALYDAVWRMCDEKMRGVTGRRVLVVITDGEDTSSRAELDEAIEMAQRTETIIFAISTKAGFSSVVPGVEAGTVKDDDDKKLDKLADATGGKAFFIGDRTDLERALTKVAKELRGQYIITYRPTNKNYDGSYRRIEVKLAAERNGLKVRTRRGYTARADRTK